MDFSTHHTPKRNFFNHDPDIVAVRLLGAILWRETKSGEAIGGRIVETEAYLADSDPAAHHITRGRTKSTAAKFMQAGTIYVHRIHRHFCMDIVTQSEEVPSSILIRAIAPTHGIDTMRARRNTQSLFNLASGPGKLCQAMGIDSSYNCHDILDPACSLHILVPNRKAPSKTIGRSGRIGVSKGAALQLRVFLKDSRYLSR